ncbi:hypothetical protein, partial [Escherichia coli]|uniref:hypothetical protein n=1 Tax=Escherichia coli TaxID=562 RepID=UPI001AD8C71F
FGDVWYADSGASNHMMCHESWFYTLKHLKSWLTRKQICTLSAYDEMVGENAGVHMFVIVFKFGSVGMCLPFIMKMAEN